MAVRISGRGIDLGNSLREYATKEVDNLLEKYLGDDVETSVVVGKDNRLFEVEICAYLNKGFVVKTNGASDDAYRAVSIALERLEERIKKHKNRIKDKARRAEWAKGLEAMRYLVERKAGTEDADEEHLIIAEQEGEILSLSVSEAVMKLDLTDMPVVMFKNAESGRINVVYKRADGHTGWIDYKDQ
ncbi:MAG: ribosome-associated translation inhibitor RaiA [Alphaproteobacteria bacterium]|nr:ribosome-associated translation inhibitor RaiA [Alphaproteobacteria bacterium]